MLDTLPTFAVVYLYLVALGLGLILGSAFNCLSYRIVHNQKWSGASRSACPHCGHTLGAKDLVPVFSYVFLKGKCRYCGTKISPRYPITEAVMGLCFMSLLWRFGLSFDTLSAAVLCCCLFCLSLVDLETQIIPDRFLVIPAVVRILQLGLEGGFSAILHGMVPGLVIGGSVLVLSLIMDAILKKDTMGGGDIKLMAVIGLFFPLSHMLLFLIFACIIGIVVAAVLMKVNPDAPFPFGPALSIGGWLTLVVGDALIEFYLGLFL